MSFNLRDIREISDEPLTKFVSHLAYRIQKLAMEQQTQELENKEDIYSNGQDIDTVLRFHSLISTKTFDFSLPFYPPTEPDLDKNTLWIQGHNMGDSTRDLSGFNNIVDIQGDPLIQDGAPFDYGIHTGGTKSIALRFNRPTSDSVNEEYIKVLDNTRIQVSGISTGISFFMRVKLFDLSSQGGFNRTLFEKIDDSTPNNGAILIVTPDGRLRFHIKKGGTFYNSQTAVGTIVTNTVYDIWCTFTVSGNVNHVYVNNVDKSLTDPGNPNFQSTLTNHDLYIFRRGEGSNGGYTYGDFYDLEIFREKVASPTEISHHYTNKWTLADIPFGQVMITDYYSTYREHTGGYDSTGYDSTGYDAS